MTIKGIITAFRYVQTALVALPALFTLVVKIRAAFGSEAVQEALKALGGLIDKIAPSAPMTDGTGNTPANPEREKRRRFFRFRNRLEVAGIITDAEAQELCVQHHSNPQEIA